MSKKKNNRTPRKCASEAQKRAIRKCYAVRAAKAKAENARQSVVPAPTAIKQSDSRVGKVYRGETKYIDIEPKKQRDYVVVRDGERGVTVSKLKTIKKFDENGKNADSALVEINQERYGLPNRTGVDFQRFDKNRMSGRPLRLDDKDVFPEPQERFTLGSNDKHNVLKHVGRIRDKNKHKK